MTSLLFAAAVVLLLGAHVVRCYRHALLFPRKYLASRFDLLLALSLSNVVNVLVPFHLGELLRVLFVAVRYRLRVSFVAATVVAERLFDVMVVLTLVAAYGALEPALTPRLAPIAAGLGALALASTSFALLVAGSGRFRCWIWKAASLFNDALRVGLVDLAWSSSQVITNGTVFRRTYVAATAGMWALYLASYALFARAVEASTVDVTLALVGEPQRPLLLQLLDMGSTGHVLALFAFTALPVAAILFLGLVRRSGVWRSLGVLRRYGFEALGILDPMTRERFSDAANYAAFLESHFTGRNAIVSRLGTLAAPDAVVHKLLPGGSDAITAVVEADSSLLIRKFASGAAGDKLAVQAEWMRGHEASLPLAAVMRDRRGDTLYSYDMPFLTAARDFYEVIHTGPIVQSCRILVDVVDRMRAFHEEHASADADDETVDAYLEQKVRKNAEQIFGYAAALFPGGAYKVNGVEHHLDEWRVLLDRGWLRAQVRSRATAVIHGDLTVENIIVNPGTGPGWYLIDPNPTNLLDTPLIDWAKLMQSLDLGYEGLNRGGHAVTVQGDDVTLLFSRSTAYAKLHALLVETLSRSLAPEQLREIAFHEIVNYLRLVPYKIRHHPQKALTFFACTSVLLRRYGGGEAVAEPDLQRWYA